MQDVYLFEYSHDYIMYNSSRAHTQLVHGIGVEREREREERSERLLFVHRESARAGREHNNGCSSSTRSAFEAIL
jgi:hypothetical protein